jgi:hypothetical protein
VPKAVQHNRLLTVINAKSNAGQQAANFYLMRQKAVQHNSLLTAI